MKKIISFFVFAAVGLMPLKAQIHEELSVERTRSDIAADITRAGCNYHSYEFHEEIPVDVPEGFVPVYVSHYGRHGSRYVTGDSAFKYVIKKLNQLSDKGLLNKEGRNVLKKVKELYNLSADRFGRLSPLGAEEQAKLGMNLYSRVPEVFSGEGTVRARSSVSRRCIASMESFTGSLKAVNASLLFDKNSNKENMSYISPGGKSVSREGTTAYLDSLSEVILNPELVIRPLVTDYRAAIKQFGHPAKFERALWECYSDIQCMPVDYELLSTIPFDELYKLWLIRNSKIFMYHARSAEYGAQRLPFARTLVDDIIEKADEALSGGEIKADLRFGHDSALLAFLAYIGVTGCDTVIPKEDIAIWPGYRFMSMGTNIQFLFYRNEEGKVIVRILHNERPTAIAAIGPGPFYDWIELRTYLNNL